MNHTTIVSTQELADNLNNPDWVVLDCRFTLTSKQGGRDAYAEGHIPGARYVHLDDDLAAPHVPGVTGRHPLPDAAMLADKFGQLGITASTQVVVYDDSFGSMAVRAWWLLRWLGHPQVALLDGGYPRWKKEQHPISTEVPAVTASTFTGTPNMAMLATADDVAAAIAAGKPVIDARPEARFQGIVEPLDPVAGHIPGAINRPFEDNLDMRGSFISGADLREDLSAQIGNATADEVIHMCGSGVTTCHNLLAFEHAGLSGGRLYIGSWSEWITDPSRAVATGE